MLSWQNNHHFIPLAIETTGAFGTESFQRAQPSERGDRRASYPPVPPTKNLGGGGKYGRSVWHVITQRT